MNRIAKATVDRGDNDAYNNNSFIFILIGVLIHFQSPDFSVLWTCIFAQINYLDLCEGPNLTIFCLFYRLYYREK